MKTTTKYFFLILLLSTALVSQTGHAQSWNKIGITNPTTGWASIPSITIDKSGTIYVAFGNINDQASVMKYTGGSWAAVGTPSISAGGVNTCGQPVSMVTDASGTPYIAYPDTDAKATVMKFDGTNWVPVGSTSFSEGQAVGISIAVDGSGTPYVVYEELDTTLPGAIVMKYDGTSWVRLATGLSTGYANFTAIAIAPDGTPYIAFGDLNNGNKATVYEYTDSAWSNVGAPDFTIGSALYTTIAIDNSGTPYICFEGESTSPGGAAVMKYNGTTWQTVGTAGFGIGGAGFPIMTLDTNGTPYVAYEDGSTPNQQATVVKYNGTDWVTVGTTGFSAGAVSFVPIAIDPTSGIPYVTYTDTSIISLIGHIAVMKYDAATGINNINNHTASISIFPDPSHGEFTLNISYPSDEDATITITNMAGQVVKQLVTPTNKAAQVQLQVAPGTYYLSAIVNGEQVVKQVVVE